MKPMASQNEDLETHIKTCLSYLDTHFIQVGAAKNVAKVFNITEKEAVQALKATVIFHDFGKAAQEYQQKKAAGKLSFPKHEYFSATAAYQTLAETSWKNECVIAILWHHMAMRGPNFAVDIKSWRKFKAPNSATVNNEFIEVLESIIFEHDLTDVIIRSFPVKISFSEVEMVTKKMYHIVKNLQTGFETYRRCLRLLRPLLIVDNLAAALFRDGGVKVFVSDLPNPRSVAHDAEVLKKLMKKI